MGVVDCLFVFAVELMGAIVSAMFVLGLKPTAPLWFVANGTRY